MLLYAQGLLLNSSKLTQAIILRQIPVNNCEYYHIHCVTIKIFSEILPEHKLQFCESQD